MAPIDWPHLLALSAKERKRELDAAVRAFLAERHFADKPLRTYQLAELLAPNLSATPYKKLCETLCRMAPFFGSTIATHDGPTTFKGGRGWLWHGDRYDARDKVRDEIANNKEQWS
jgi:hypothetical protein